MNFHLFLHSTHKTYSFVEIYKEYLVSYTYVTEEGMVILVALWIIINIFMLHKKVTNDSFTKFNCSILLSYIGLF